MKQIGFFEIKDKDLGGRIGKLYTPHGVLETPALLPVIDVVRQEVPIEEIEKAGFRAVITNAYLLWKRLRKEALERGVHGVLGFNGIIMTDSGAYQILEYGDIEIKPKEVIEFEKAIGSDIAVILDIPTGNARDRKQAEYSVQETLRRAQEAVHQIDADKRVWVLPVQGGPFRDLVEKSAKESARLPYYQLYALGSPTVLLERYDYPTLLDMLFTARTNLPLTKPLHLFGAGHPMVIPFAVALGADMFDSASYILYARDNRYMTLRRTYRLEELEEFPCSCPVCTKHTPKELLEMPKAERTRLLALHNLYVLRQAINEVKTAIREGRLWELLEEKSRAHPSLAKAFANFRHYVEFLEKVSPRIKSNKAKGIFLYGPESLFNPRIKYHYNSILTRYRPRKRGTLVLLPIDPDAKPFTNSTIYREIRKMFNEHNAHIVGYIQYIGIIPEELAETYPLSQFEANIYPYEEVISKTAKIVEDYITRNKATYNKIVIVVCKGMQPNNAVSRAIIDRLSEKGLPVEIFEKDCNKKS
ncbi:tRNA guanosine(15) transglycosylase TgtA [Pyrofollis japonicus]|uniref:tRNA guanosine(15) transglycosylase TgtA n=1 Tax=Pyrofollis japonicus TaxID=3060460 RepID=UPI00295C378E|nr:tRNA guanosine(15) transglycosylase TgtA [Pyrofollis japonicus]BEP18587.1 tRNA guanosine(15) transglycosylase TgtA [Pyrofollis japonicus]